MITNRLQKEVSQQIGIGFSGKEIEQYLQPKGYTSTEINDVLSKTNFSSIVAERNGGSVLAGAGSLTAVSMTNYYFTRRV